MSKLIGVASPGDNGTTSARSQITSDGVMSYASGSLYSVHRSFKPFILLGDLVFKHSTISHSLSYSIVYLKLQSPYPGRVCRFNG